VIAAGDCKVLNLDVPDPATLSLKDGNHVIASAAASRGRLEVKVTVKDKDISENQYYLGGRLMRETPESQVPKAIRECPAMKRSAMPSVGTWLAAAFRGLWDQVEPRLEARRRVSACKVLSESCGDSIGGGGTCCVLVSCSGSTGFSCVGY
jgi:hypothetical protein